MVACVASASVWFRSKERGTRVKDGAKNGASIPKIPSLGLSLPRNQTETLATQANSVVSEFPAMDYGFLVDSNR